MKNLALTSIAILLTTMSLAGCKGGGGGVNSGVDSTKTGEELSEEEIAKLCEATADYVTSELDTKDGACRMVAFPAAFVAYALGGGDEDAMREACTEAYEECLEEDEEQEETVQCEDTPESISDCEATVAEYETCVEDRVAEMKDLEKTVPTCAELSEDDLEELADLIEDGPTGTTKSCEDLADSCPVLAGLSG